MQASFITLLKKNGIISAIIFIMALILGNFSLYWYNRIIFFESLQAKKEVEAVEKKLEFIWTQVQIADMGVRGYLLIPEDAMAVPLLQAAARYSKGIEELEQMLISQQFDVTTMESFKKMYIAKMEEALLMKRLKQEGNGEQAVAILQKDTGYQLWLTFKPIQERILAFEDKVKQEADSTYQNSLANTLIIQVILLLLSIPTLCLVIYRLLQNEWQKKALFEKLKQSTEKYLFCETNQEVNTDEEKVITGLVNHLQTASQFVKEIAKGNYDLSWQSINQANAHLNKDNLTGNLIQMREQMKKVKEEDQKRLWTNQGFAKFADLSRLNEDTLELRIQVFLTELIKYVKVNQGAVFLISDKNEAGKDDSVPLLELKACYAYGKKKYIKKVIYLGEGLVGQAFQEKGRIWLTDVPRNYITISSGLGEDLPRCVLIVPMCNNEQIVGVVELASFQVLEEYQIQFIEKVVENLAGVVVSARIHEHTRDLLKEASQRAEEMRAQEEEMRQNMEELEATQEEMRRNEGAHLQEITRLEQDFQTNTILLQKKDAEMSGFLSAVNSTLATIEFDLEGNILKANEIFLNLMGYKLEEIKNQPHNIFVEEAYKNSKEYEKFWQELRAGKSQIGKVKRFNKEGKQIWLNASYTLVFDINNRPTRVIKLAQFIDA